MMDWEGDENCHDVEFMDYNCNPNLVDQNFIESEHRNSHQAFGTEMPVKMEFDYKFQRQVPVEGHDKKLWEYSSLLDKIFIPMDKVITLYFSFIDCQPGTLYHIRAQPSFSGDSDLKEPVKRCPVHLADRSPANDSFMYKEHVLRCETGEPNYCVENSKYSVKVAIGDNQDVSIAYKFVCKSSCKGGMNRRPIHILFTLEDSRGNVFGSNALAVKVSSIPKRDLEKEEGALSEKIKKNIDSVKKRKKSLETLDIRADLRNWFYALDKNDSKKKEILMFMCKVGAKLPMLEGNEECLTTFKEVLAALQKENPS